MRLIKVNRLNGKELVINCELIETIEATPDTVITLTNGKKIVVKEGVDILIDLTIEYKRKIMGYCEKTKG